MLLNLELEHWTSWMNLIEWVVCFIMKYLEYLEHIDFLMFQGNNLFLIKICEAVYFILIIKIKIRQRLSGHANS